MDKMLERAISVNPNIRRTKRYHQSRQSLICSTNRLSIEHQVSKLYEVIARKGTEEGVLEHRLAANDLLDSYKSIFISLRDGKSCTVGSVSTGILGFSYVMPEISSGKKGIVIKNNKYIISDLPANGRVLETSEIKKFSNDYAEFLSKNGVSTSKVENTLNNLEKLTKDTSFCKYLNESGVKEAYDVFLRDISSYCLKPIYFVSRLEDGKRVYNLYMSE